MCLYVCVYLFLCVPLCLCDSLCVSVCLCVWLSVFMCVSAINLCVFKYNTFVLCILLVPVLVYPIKQYYHSYAADFQLFPSDLGVKVTTSYPDKETSLFHQ